MIGSCVVPNGPPIFSAFSPALKLICPKAQGSPAGGAKAIHNGGYCLCTLHSQVVHLVKPRHSDDVRFMPTLQSACLVPTDEMRPFRERWRSNRSQEFLAALQLDCDLVFRPKVRSLRSSRSNHACGHSVSRIVKLMTAVHSATEEVLAIPANCGACGQFRELGSFHFGKASVFAYCAQPARLDCEPPRRSGVEGLPNGKRAWIR